MDKIPTSSTDNRCCRRSLKKERTKAIMHVMQKDNKSRVREGEIFCALAVLIIITIKCGDWIYYKPCILQVLAVWAFWSLFFTTLHLHTIFLLSIF